MLPRSAIPARYVDVIRCFVISRIKYFQPVNHFINFNEADSQMAYIIHWCPGVISNLYRHQALALLHVNR